MKLFEIITSDNGDFICAYNKLKFLKDVPPRILGSFNCSSNKLTSLEGAPSEIGGYFNCSSNKLTSLEGAPSEIGGYFSCGHNKLTSLEGAPSTVGKDFYCFDNELTSLKGAPSEIGGDFQCQYNKLTSLKDIHKIINKMNGKIDADMNPIKSHILGVLLIPGCEKLSINNKQNRKISMQVQDIINKYLPNNEGMKGVLKCQEELFAADLDEYAQL